MQKFELNSLNALDFRFRLAIRQKEFGTLLCVGLDPDIELMPDHIKKEINSFDDDKFKAEIVAAWAIDEVDATAEYACMFKPQIAHWEALGTCGLKALTRVVSHIKQAHPGIVVFLDCKRGDIDDTQKKYGIACFDKYGVDGMNFNPYMGKSCMKALFNENHPERALVGLCFTSNPDARETQDAMLMTGETYWQFIAKLTLSWAQQLGQGVLNNAGLVMAAAYPDKIDPSLNHYEHLIGCRKIVGDNFWFLIPGIGKQGGLMKETIEAAYVGYGSIAINESRSIIFASKGEDYLLASKQAAEKSRDTMRLVLASM